MGNAPIFPKKISSKLSRLCIVRYWGKASCGIEYSEFIVCERVQVNPDNSRALSALNFYYSYWRHCIKKHFIETTIYKVNQAMMWWQWCVEFTPRPLHHDDDVKEVVSSQPSITWYKSSDQKIGFRTVYESWLINCEKTWTCLNP